MTETLYSPRNDPDPEMIPNPEMIPKSTPKWFPFLFTSTPKFQFGVEFGDPFRVGDHFEVGIISGAVDQVLWARETEQPTQTLVFTKTAGRHNLRDSQPGVNLIKLLHV